MHILGSVLVYHHNLTPSQTGALLLSTRSRRSLGPRPFRYTTLTCPSCCSLRCARLSSHSKERPSSSSGPSTPAPAAGIPTPRMFAPSGVQKQQRRRGRQLGTRKDDTDRMRSCHLDVGAAACVAAEERDSDTTAWTHPHTSDGRGGWWPSEGFKLVAREQGRHVPRLRWSWGAVLNSAGGGGCAAQQ